MVGDVLIDGSILHQKTLPAIFFFKLLKIATVWQQNCTNRCFLLPDQDEILQQTMFLLATLWCKQCIALHL